MVGPAALFRSADGRYVGTVEQRLGSLEPSVVTFKNPLDTEQAMQVVTFGKGAIPLDPTLGNAHKIETTSETFLEHVKKGGPVMYPIFGIAGLALLVALYKFFALLFVRSPSQRKMRALLQAVAKRDKEAAMREAKSIGGPGGKMLMAGVEHLEEPRELIEEIMYEKVLSTRLKLNRLLPFIAITASSSPLLGLLGTVTGIMNTFTLMTVFGTGDVKTLSSGISEALITTEFGLYVAIPSLLLYAFLSRRARAIIDQMEKAGVAFVNQVGKTPFRKTGAARHDVAAMAIETNLHADREETRHQTTEQVREVLADMLRPLVKDEVGATKEKLQKVRGADEPARASRGKVVSTSATSAVDSVD